MEESISRVRRREIEPHGLWTCKIGEVDWGLPPGSDLPMRDAISDAYERLTGERPVFIFSGWRGELTEGERAVVEDRLPDPMGQMVRLGDVFATLNRAERIGTGVAWGTWAVGVLKREFGGFE